MVSDHAMSEKASVTTEKNSREVYSTLLEWIRKYGGNLHENVYLSYDEKIGTHLRVKSNGVPSNTHIINTPVVTTMSYFNAIDHRAGETHFPSHGVNLPTAFKEAVDAEEVAIFFLVGQYLRGSEGFWYPYIQTLPQPGSLTTLPYYTEDEDVDWLEGTSLAEARKQKIATLQNRYQSSSTELRKSGFEDAEKFTWDLYLWASTMFFSRAFTAKVLSAVIPELDVPEHVSVLLPFFDISNHRPLSKVEWRAGTKNIDYVVLENVGAGQEISNNYGPRNNEQLMMNYGFCLADNTCDYRRVALRAPPGSPLHFAREQQKHLFPNLPDNAEDPYYVFNIFYPLLAPEIPMEHSAFSPALFNAVSILAANERELETLEISEHVIQIANTYGSSRAAISALSQITIELITHIVRLRSSEPETQPQNLKQTHAKIYRDTQTNLSETALVIASWSLTMARTHGLKGGLDETKHLLNQHMSLFPQNKFPEEISSRIQFRILERPSILLNTGELFTLPELLDLLPHNVQTPSVEAFQKILTTTSRRIEALRGVPETDSPFRFPIFACLVVAIHTTNRHKHALPSGQRENFLPARLSQWASFLLDHYLPPPDDVAWALEDADDENLVAEFDDVLERLRARDPDILKKVEPFTGGQGVSDAWWLSPNWIRWAWMMTEQECVRVPEKPLAMLAAGEEGGGDVMLSTETYLYIPQDQ
ncbi:hypothetical protein BJX70DRAFT_108738 [Aspergillus crustosus]